MTIHSLKRSFAPRNIENQIRNLDPFQATNWNDACLKDRPTTDSFFLRGELILLRNLFHSCLNPYCMRKKLPSLRFPFRSLYFNENPPGIPLPRIYRLQSFLLFSPRARKSAGSRGRRFSVQVLRAPRCK